MSVLLCPPMWLSDRFVTFITPLRIRLKRSPSAFRRRVIRPPPCAALFSLPSSQSSRHPAFRTRIFGSRSTASRRKDTFLQVIARPWSLQKKPQVTTMRTSCRRQASASRTRCRTFRSLSGAQSSSLFSALSLKTSFFKMNSAAVVLCVTWRLSGCVLCCMHLCANFACLACGADNLS